MNETYAILIGSINTEFAERALSIIQDKVSNDCTHLHLAIQSSGGSVPIALSLANILQSLPCKITTYNIGNVTSAAVIIFAAGAERVCTREAIFCVHPISKSVTGDQTVETLTSVIQEIEADTERVTNFLFRRSGKTTPARWRELMSKPHVIPADVAVEIGLAHRVDECLFDFGRVLSAKSFPEVFVEHFNPSPEPSHLVPSKSACMGKPDV